MFQKRKDDISTFIRSFHSSILHVNEVLPQYQTIILSLGRVEPIRHSERGPPFLMVRWLLGGGRYNASWNDLPLDVWFSLLS